jgi:hypothetical protein
MTTYEQIELVLDGLGLPFGMDVYLPETGGAMPDTYLIYSIILDDHIQHADNRDVLRDATVQVLYFSRLGLARMPDIDAAFEAAGFINGVHTKLPYAPDTRHFGLALTYTFLEEQS